MKDKSKVGSLSWTTHDPIKYGICDFILEVKASELFKELKGKGLSSQDIESIFQNMGMNIYDTHIDIITS